MNAAGRAQQYRDGIANAAQQNDLQLRLNIAYAQVSRGIVMPDLPWDKPVRFRGSKYATGAGSPKHYSGPQE